MSEQIDMEKMQRRHKRNLRNVRAKGLLQGIVSMLKEGDVVFDCGANVGVVTGPLAQTGAIVHAFEPDPWAFGQLEKKFASTENVILHNVAVGVVEGTIQLMRAADIDANPKGASVKSTTLVGARNIDAEACTSVDVPLINFPAMLEEQFSKTGEIAFVKMDIEGAELELLQKMHKSGLFNKICLTVAETHEHKFKELRPQFKALRNDISAEFPITKVNLDWI